VRQPVPGVNDLESILRSAIANNEPLGVTGALIFDDQWFVQILEGEPDVVKRLFESLKGDDRHTEIKLIELIEVEGRFFANWWMWCGERNAATFPLFEPFLRDGAFKPGLLSGAEILRLAMNLTTAALKKHVASVTN
jgi:hypothetical protein